jgi:CheY-like chemotaxis protein
VAPPEAITPPLPEVNAPLDSPAVPSPKALPASTSEGDVRSPDDPGISHAPVAILKVPTESAKKAKPKRPSTLPIAKAIADTKILIVDDDRLTRNLVQMQLNNLGYILCSQAESGNEAVKLAKEIIPDFIFMDIHMPGEIDGIDAAREIRAHMNSRIIFLTGCSDPETVNRAGEIHPNGYILKPFTTTDLRVAIELRK